MTVPDNPRRSQTGVEINTDYGTATAVRSGRAGEQNGPVAVFDGVSKRFGHLLAVDGLSLELRKGETVALLGPNGAGMSSSLDMLLALRKPTSGTIRMFGTDPYRAVKEGPAGSTAASTCPPGSGWSSP